MTDADTRTSRTSRSRASSRPKTPKPKPADEVQAAPLAPEPAPEPPPPPTPMPAADERVAVGTVTFEATRSRFIYPDGTPADPDDVFAQVGKTRWVSTKRVLAVQRPAKAGGRAVTRLMFPVGKDFSTAEVAEMKQAMRG